MKSIFKRQYGFGKFRKLLDFRKNKVPMFLILDKILIIDVPCSWLKIREWLSEYFFFAKVCDKHNISVNCNNLDQIYSIWTFIIKASFHKISFSQNERLIISEFLIRHDLPEKLEAACGRRPQRPQVCRPLYLDLVDLDTKVLVT